jgi:hypothetical protein
MRCHLCMQEFCCNGTVVQDPELGQVCLLFPFADHTVSPTKGPFCVAELLQNCDVEQQYFSVHCLAHREAGNVVDVFICVCLYSVKEK